MATAFQLSNGTLLISTEAPGGVYNADQLAAISELAKQHGAIVKATEDHRLALLVPEQDVSSVEQVLGEVGVSIRHYQAGLHQPISCIGALCPMHQQDSLTAAIELTEALTDLKLHTPLKIGINGCSRVCVATHTLDISIIADVGGYRVSLGGKNSQIPEMAMFMAEGVPAEKIVGLVEGVIKVYADLAQEDESLQEVMERAGNQPFIAALAPYSQDAHAGDDPFAGFGDGDDTGQDDSTLLEMEEIDADEEFAEDSPTSTAQEENMDFEELGFEDENEDPLLSDIDPKAQGDDVTFDDDVVISEDDLELEDGDLLADDPQALADRMLAEGQNAELEDEQFEDDSSDVDEVSEEEADAFEQKLAASIEEEQAVPAAQDENSDERMHAVEMIEASGTQDMGADDLVEIDDDSLAADVASLQSEALDGDFDDDFDEEPVVSKSHPVASQQFGSPKNGSKLASQWTFAGLEPLHDGRILIRFHGGAEVAIDPNIFQGNREFTIGTTEIRITTGSQGCQIDIDGMGLFLPRAAA